MTASGYSRIYYISQERYYARSRCHKHGPLHICFSWSVIGSRH